MGARGGVARGAASALETGSGATEMTATNHPAVEGERGERGWGAACVLVLTDAGAGAGAGADWCWCW